MNNPLAQLNTTARSLFKTRHSAIRTNTLHPGRDWFIGVGIGLGIMSTLAAWNAYMFVINRNNDPDTTQVATAVPVYKAQLIDQAKQVVTDREAAFAVLQKKSTVPAIETQDPIATTTTASTTPEVEAEDTLTTTDAEVEESIIGDETETTVTTEEISTSKSETQETTQEEGSETTAGESAADVELDAAPEWSV